MKKPLVAFCILALCTLLMSINVVTIKAAEPGYERYDWMPDTSVTIIIDGNWTTENEWTYNGEVTPIGEGEDASFRSVWTLVTTPSFSVIDTFLVEFFSDTTDDEGDYWQICIDGDQSGGAAPQTGDYRIDILGHANLTMYEGNGADWTEVTPPASIEWADSLSASPTNSTPHWILEIRFPKGDVGAAEYWNFRLAVYDESTDTLLSWPPTDRDVPNGYGIQNYHSEAIPEAFSLGVVVLLSSVAVAVGFYCLRKRSRTDEYGLGKLGK